MEYTIDAHRHVTVIDRRTGRGIAGVITAIKGQAAHVKVNKIQGQPRTERDDLPYTMHVVYKGDLMPAEQSDRYPGMWLAIHRMNGEDD